MQYHTFRLTPKAKRAISCIEDSKVLNKLSLKQLMLLKADLYGYKNLTTEELIEKLNSFKRPQLREFNDMDPQEQKVANALVRLTNHARRRMIRIAEDYKNMRPSESRQDIHDLSFVFRNNGRNFRSYPEITAMNSEVSWYHHRQLFPRRKSFWDKFSERTIKNTVRLGKAAVVGAYVWLGSWLASDEKEKVPSQFDFQTAKTEQPVIYKNSLPAKTYQAKAEDFSRHGAAGKLNDKVFSFSKQTRNYSA